jgi:hypothetical protein
MVESVQLRTAASEPDVDPRGTPLISISCHIFRVHIVASSSGILATDIVRENLEDVDEDIVEYGDEDDLTIFLHRSVQHLRRNRRARRD